ncbi:PREDICTED: vacuolar protein-sorting-associated protein 36-like [Acropora digitifera]|uniref:vacuolar protein-sorting-associated protein 36-like n=1 Tax=Acropora digitifera TaxID=70779 RepID=UPI00077AF319|nr:PREDICTED: vacuolar protein-sorting-associated protein 36-like [Acropora digitifera]
MDRFSWTSPSTPCVFPGESGIHRQSGVRIYDGDKKTTFDNGDLKLTTHRLVWNDLDQQDRAISLSLSLVSKVTEQSSGFMSSAKVVVELHPSPANKEPGPCVSSSYSCVKFSFKQGGHSEFLARLVEQVNKKSWTPQTSQSSSVAGTGPSRTRGIGGIVGIERKLEEKSKETDNYIQKAFKDLDALMDKAKEMVAMADKVASKLEEKKGSISEDEVIKAFLRLFLAPSSFLFVNLFLYYFFPQLVSPDDLINAANIFASVNIPLRLDRGKEKGEYARTKSEKPHRLLPPLLSLLNSRSTFPTAKALKPMKASVALATSGIMTHAFVAMIFVIAFVPACNNFFSARDRLLVTEQAGKACRDDSVEGLRFYPNRFLEREG